MFNKVIILGYLARDIELRYSPGANLAIASTNIATTRRTTDNNGEKREETCFVDITFFGKLAEIANQYLKKGSLVMVEGRLKLDTWQDKDGKNRSKHSVIVEELKMLPKDTGKSGSPYESAANKFASNEQRVYNKNQGSSYVQKQGFDNDISYNKMYTQTNSSTYDSMNNNYENRFGKEQDSYLNNTYNQGQNRNRGYSNYEDSQSHELPAIDLSSDAIIHNNSNSNKKTDMPDIDVTQDEELPF